MHKAETVNGYKIFHMITYSSSLVRAGGNGTTSTAMAIAAFEGEKWHPLDSSSHVCYWTAVDRSLGHLNVMRPSLDIFESSNIQSSDEKIEAFSIFHGDIG